MLIHSGVVVKLAFGVIGFPFFSLFALFDVLLVFGVFAILLELLIQGLLMVC